MALGDELLHFVLVTDRQLFLPAKGSEHEVYSARSCDSKGLHAVKLFQLNNMEADDPVVEHTANLSSVPKEEPPRSDSPCKLYDGQSGRVKLKLLQIEFKWSQTHA